MNKIVLFHDLWRQLSANSVFCISDALLPPSQKNTNISIMRSSTLQNLASSLGLSWSTPYNTWAENEVEVFEGSPRNCITSKENLSLGHKRKAQYPTQARRLRKWWQQRSENNRKVRISGQIRCTSFTTKTSQKQIPSDAIQWRSTAC